jgi:flagellar hook-length control protein FliK
VAQNAQPVQTAQHDGDAAAVRVAVQAASADAGQAGKDGNADGGATAGGNNASNAAAQIGATLASAPASAQPAADTVKLAGPPTAWRQSLQEALGERLQLQVGNKVEQAVIRLEPPQLGQIDIAIRHSAGSLEVNISATNSEVLRQLQTVSDNLKSELSQRQFSEVAVTVTPAPKNNAAPFGDPQQQGRGRQQGREQDEYEPGRALAEAGNPASAFSLGGRDRT